KGARRSRAEVAADEPRQPAPVTPRRPQSALAAVHDLEGAAEPVRRPLVVGIGERYAHATAVEIGELDARGLVEAVLRVGAPEAGLLDAAPRRLHRAEGVRVVVRPDHPGFQLRGYASRTVEILRPDARSEP